MRKLLFSIALSIIIILTGCGHVKDAGQLYKYAKKTYGKCQVVSKVEEENMTKLVLKDRLQGFNYTVTSSMSDISIDGSSFGSLPSTSDTFNKSLTEYVRTECSLKLNEIKSKYGIDIEAPDFVSETIVTLLIPASVSKTDAIKAATEIAEEFQKYNLKNRLDGCLITIEHDDDWTKAYLEEHKRSGDYESDYFFSSAESSDISHIGSIKLPDTSFRDSVKETEDFFLDQAKMLDEDAVFLRSEKHPLSDTGLTTDTINNSYASGAQHIKSDSDLITFYYFKAGRQEFYICDVQEAGDYRWYTNYKK